MYLEDHPSWYKWLVTPIYKPFSPFERGTKLIRGQKLTMGKLTTEPSPGMILQRRETG